MIFESCSEAVSGSSNFHCDLSKHFVTSIVPNKRLEEIDGAIRASSCTVLIAFLTARIERLYRSDSSLKGAPLW